MTSRIRIYTDGGASPNPGPGGWGAVLLRQDDAPQELSGGETETTNNRMEMLAAIEALSALPGPSEIDFYTDSQYLKRGITDWMAAWRARKWRTKTGQPVKNQDLWQRLDALIAPHEITWHWVRGHAGDRYNERAHQLASAAIPSAALATDEDAIQVYLRIAGPLNNRMGACGWAASIIDADGERHISGGYANLGVNHCGLRAALEVLQGLPEDMPVQCFTNHAYLLDGITNWVNGWRAGNWSKDIKYKDDWRALDALNRAREITWQRVRQGDLPPPMRPLEKLAQRARDAAGR